MTTERLLNLLRQIDRAGQVNPYAIAFMMTESRFRGPFFRALEICWMIFALKVLRRKPHLTLGQCQVGFVHWQAMFGDTAQSLTLAMLDDFSNYRVCCEYLDALGPSGLKETSIYYNGRPSALYVQLLTENLTTVRLLMGHLRINRSM